MAESSVSFLVNNLSRLIQNEAKLLGGLKSEVECIRDELEHIKAFLRVADSKEETDPQLGAWVKQVRNIAYDIEDVLDNYMIQFPHHGVTGRIEKIYAPLKNLKHRHQLASEIKKIKLKVEHATEGYRRYNTEKYTSTMNQISSYDGRGDALLLEDADVVGIENPKKQLSQWICSANYELKVISLVGMGGSGKTTIAKKVYDDKATKEKFVHHVWITISESYDVESLLRRMINLLLAEIKQSTPQNLEGMEGDEMKEFIYKFLQHKKYIIVLDDIWKREAWEAIKYAFPKSKTEGCGCIIITTRFATIGNVISGETKGHVFKVEPLPTKEAKQLFYKKAFLGKPCIDNRLLTISENILQKCDGLPLAIIVIGGLLAKNQNFAEWEALNNSLGDELKEERMNKIISLSFFDMPFYLKSCFLYLSFFPEDEFLDRWRLIRLWIAEGFVEEKSEKTMEDVAQGYLNELVNRCLIQVANIGRGGYPTHFRIHDLVREYILLKSGHEVVVIKNGRGTHSPDRIRRIAFDASFSVIPESYRLESLRSMLWVGNGDAPSGEIINKVLGRGCKLLKELDLRGAPIEIIPDEVYMLYHLKYLSLRNTKVSRISKSIKHLRNLETLDLKSTSVIELPVEVLKLQKLRHLLVYKYEPHVNGYRPSDSIQSFKFPFEIGRLSSLQKLVHLVTDEVGGMKTVTEIGKLTQLRKLGLIKIKKEDGMKLCTSLAKLTNLRSLSLRSNGEDEVLDLQHSPSSITFPFLHTLDLQGILLKIPLWIASLDGLTRLYLRWSGLRDNDEDPLERLHGLPNLRDLYMSCAYEGEELNFKVGGFQRLKILRLRRLRKLRRVRVEEGSMPLLQKLYMSDCEKVEDVPQGVQYLFLLQYVQFTDMSQAFVNKIHNQKRKDVWRLEHVPAVYIFNYVNGIREGGRVQEIQLVKFFL